MRNKIKFIDLFAGLGGFHHALEGLGMECVFASEIDRSLQDLYEINYGMKPAGDIRLIDEKDIPGHSVLCAGFPCQPFSLAGKKKGNKCPTSGKLIDDVFRIIRHHNPKYVFLENVPNILTIADGKFWSSIEKNFALLGYKIDYKIYSPVDFGIPQKRKRVFVIAVKDGSPNVTWPELKQSKSKNLLDYIANKHGEIDRTLEPKKEAVIELWGDIVNHINDLSYHFLLSAEFGATYPTTGMKKMSLKEAKKYKGAWGASLANCSSWKEIADKLPHYINETTFEPGDWLKESINYSRSVYKAEPRYFNKVKKKLMKVPQSWQKLQWQGEREERNIWDHLIQFRASGIRVVRPISAPSLVAMTTTQIPIIGKNRKYMNEREAAALQGLNNLKRLPTNPTAAFKALGNAVNSTIIRKIAEVAIR